MEDRTDSQMVCTSVMLSWWSLSSTVDVCIEYDRAMFSQVIESGLFIWNTVIKFLFCRKIPLLALSDNVLEEFFLNNLLRKGPLVLLDFFFFLTNFATNHVACVSSIITYLSVSWKLAVQIRNFKSSQLSISALVFFPYSFFFLWYLIFLCSTSSM